jgi:hypothetical protein
MAPVQIFRMRCSSDDQLALLECKAGALKCTAINRRIKIPDPCDLINEDKTRLLSMTPYPEQGRRVVCAFNMRHSNAFTFQMLPFYGAVPVTKARTCL